MNRQDAKMLLFGAVGMGTALFGLLLLSGKSQAEEEPPGPTPPPVPLPPDLRPGQAPTSPAPPAPPAPRASAGPFSDLPIGALVRTRVGGTNIFMPADEFLDYKIVQKMLIDGKMRYVGETVGWLGLGAGNVGVFSESDIVARLG